MRKRGPRDKKRWNRAADLIVNGMVEHAGLPLQEGAARDGHLRPPELLTRSHAGNGRHGGGGDGGAI